MYTIPAPYLASGSRGDRLGTSVFTSVTAEPVVVVVMFSTFRDCSVALMCRPLPGPRCPPLGGLVQLPHPPPVLLEREKSDGKKEERHRNGSKPTMMMIDLNSAIVARL